MGQRAYGRFGILALLVASGLLVVLAWWREPASGGASGAPPLAPAAPSVDAAPREHPLDLTPAESVAPAERLPVGDEAPPAPEAIGTAPGALHVRVRLPDGSTPGPEALATSRIALAFVGPGTSLGPDGRSSFEDLEPGAYSLSLLVPGFELIEREVSVESGETRELELVLGRGLTIAGRVVDEFGAPLPEARVSVSSEQEDELGSHSSSLGVSVDVLGRFFLEGVSSGFVKVSARDAGRRQATLELGTLGVGDSATDLVLVLSPGSTLAGHVLDASGEAAPGATVLAFDAAADEERETAADEAGAFRFADLGAGPIRLWAWDVESGGWLHGLAALTEVPVGTTDVELRLAPPGTLELAIHGRTLESPPRVILTDRDGMPVGVRPHPFNLKKRPGMRARPTPEGLVLEDCQPGDTWIVVTEDGEDVRTGRVRTEIRAGAVSRAQVQLEPAFELALTLVRNGEPVLGALTVTADDGFLLRLAPPDEEDGSEPKRWIQLPAGHYRVFGTFEGREAAAEVTLARQLVSELRIELP